MPRKYGRSKRGFRTKTVDSQQTKAIRTLQKKVKYINQPELKTHLYNSYGSTTNQYSNVISLHLLTDTDLGTGNDERIGDSIRVKQLYFSLFCVAPAASMNYVRVILFQDKRYTGSAVTGDQLLQDYSTTNLSHNNLHSRINDSYVNDKKDGGKGINILWDSYVIPIDDALGRGSRMMFNRTWNAGLKVNYEGGTNGPGQIFAALFPGNSTTASNNSFITFYSQIRFTDV
ncbi:MAG: hypothetical protein [Cressdnaviricota sp.]|nr:MAG: hypothetical protein [Cressdnaviricota sp.]